MRHLENMAKVMLATGLIVAYGYMVETFMAFYSGDSTRRYMMTNRLFGPYAPLYWMLIACNIVIPQLLWSQEVRTQRACCLLCRWWSTQACGWSVLSSLLSACIAISFRAWGMYYPTRWDWATFVGTFGCSLLCFSFSSAFLPMISIVEVRSLVHETNEEKHS